MDELKKRAPKQAKLLEFLRDQITPSPKIALLKRLGVQSTSCSALVEKGLVEETSSRQDRIAYDDELNEVGTAVESVDVVKLTDEQSVAVESMLASRDEGGFKVHLLHGVTGSGKTEVYLRLMEAVLEGDGGVLFLVPEVSLAPRLLIGYAQGLIAWVWTPLYGTAIFRMESALTRGRWLLMGVPGLLWVLDLLFMLQLKICSLLS